MSERSERLLEAHVQHELARYHAAQLDTRMQGWARELFAWFGEVKVDDLSSEAQVLGVIERYVIALRVSGGIMELTGELAQLVLDSPASADTRLDELLVDAEYDGFAETIARLEGVWRELIGRVAHSETAELLHAQLLSRLLGDLLDGRGKRLLGRVLERLEARVAELLHQHMVKRRASLAQQREQKLLELLDPELLRSVADELWTQLSTKKLGELFQLVRKQDVEDFVVLGHEFWLHYRRSPYFHRITREVLAHFFAKYGQQSVLALIEDMGVSEAMLANELRELVGPVLQHGLHTGFLERQLRAQLRSFYDSPALLALLDDGGR
ncbi:MAG: hypothetical protein ABW352_18375 [Polyangiales bacterium]